MSKFTQINQKIADGVVKGYQKIENGVVEGYQKIENGVVDGFTRMTDTIIEKVFTRDGETVEQAKARMQQETNKHE